MRKHVSTDGVVRPAQDLATDHSSGHPLSIKSCGRGEPISLQAEGALVSPIYPSRAIELWL